MASSTKWRLNVSANNGGDALEIAEIQFRTIATSPLAFSGGTIDASSNTSSMANAADGKDVTTWFVYPATTGWWSYEYASPVEIKSYVVRSGYPDTTDCPKAPKDFTLEYWDGSAWVVADTKSNINTWGNHEVREFVVGSGSGSYTVLRGLWREASLHWRIVITANNGGSQTGFNQLQLRSVVGFNEPAYSANPAADGSASSETAGSEASQAVANTTSNYWRTASGTTAATYFIDYDTAGTFSWAKTVKQYTFTPPSSGLMPRDWTLEYFDGTDWIVADTRTGVTSATLWSITPSVGSLTNDGDITLPYLDLFGSDTYPPDVQLERLTLSGTMLQAAVYNGGVNLGNPNNFGAGFDVTPHTLAATAFASAAYAGAVALPFVDLEGSLEGPLALPLRDLVGTAIAGAFGSSDITLPSYDVQGGFEDERALPLLDVVGTAYSGNVAAGDANLLGLSAAGSLEPPLPLPLLTLAASATTGTVADGLSVLPGEDAAGTTVPDSDLTLPALDLAATGRAGAIAHGLLSLPKAVLAASWYQDGNADGDCTLARLTTSGSIVSDNLIEGGVTLGGWSVSADASTGQLLQAAITVPVLSLEAAAFADTSATATITLPLWALDAAMDSAPLTTPYTTLAVNTRNKAATTHTNMPFNSFACFQGVVLAASDSGIYALNGDDDAGTPIAALLRGGVTDMDSAQLKRVLGGYVGYRADGALDLTLITDQHHEYVYRLEPRQQGDALHPSRVKTGRGVDGRYWQWQIENTAGQAFTLDSLALDADVLKRRV